MTSSTAHATPTPDHRCVFCAHDALDVVLEETDHFLVIADHAPLAEGHLLIVPRDHYACYGALPAEFDEEALELRQRVTDFLTATYRAPVFFEHGVFRQTVFHAHLHALPLGTEHRKPGRYTQCSARMVRRPGPLLLPRHGA
jgi:diadenosine tetraphosphate (Ap4A) HIT family hydrolase